MLYAAYGSNMNVGQMKRRCPDSRIVGSAELEGYRLVFRGWNGGAVATIEKCRGCVVPLALWDISSYDENELDIYEGWPRLYRKTYVKVDLNGEKEWAMIYIMNKGREYGLPSKYYFQTIARGYKDFGFEFKRLSDFMNEQLSMKWALTKDR